VQARKYKRKTKYKLELGWRKCVNHKGGGSADETKAMRKNEQCIASLDSNVYTLSQEKNRPGIPGINNEATTKRRDQLLLLPTPDTHCFYPHGNEYVRVFTW